MLLYSHSQLPDALPVSLHEAGFQPRPALSDISCDSTLSVQSLFEAFLLYDAKNITDVCLFTVLQCCTISSVTICDVFGFVNLFWLLCLWINLIKCFIIIIFIQPLLYYIACRNIFFTLILAHKCRC